MLVFPSNRRSSSRANFFAPLLSKVLVEVEAQREVVDDKLAVTAAPRCVLVVCRHSRGEGARL